MKHWQNGACKITLKSMPLLLSFAQSAISSSASAWFSSRFPPVKVYPCHSYFRRLWVSAIYTNLIKCQNIPGHGEVIIKCIFLYIFFEECCIISLGERGERGGSGSAGHTGLPGKPGEKGTR